MVKGLRFRTEGSGVEAEGLRFRVEDEHLG